MSTTLVLQAFVDSKDLHRARYVKYPKRMLTLLGRK